jgi:hypothetical protein
MIRAPLKIQGYRYSGGRGLDYIPSCPICVETYEKLGQPSLIFIANGQWLAAQRHAQARHVSLLLIGGDCPPLNERLVLQASTIASAPS